MGQKHEGVTGAMTTRMPATRQEDHTIKLNLFVEKNLT